jgi:phosphate transport system permease protein
MLTIVALVILAAAGALFMAAQSKAVASAGGQLAKLHSRPSYHGFYCAVWVGLAGLGALFAVDIIAGLIIDGNLAGRIAGFFPDASQIEADLIASDARAIAEGRIASSVDEAREALAAYYADATQWRRIIALIAGCLGAGVAAYVTWNQIDVEWRARNRTERIVRRVLGACAVLAVLTTIGIVLSLVGETLNFFAKLDGNVFAFLFGTTWSPLSGVFEGKLDPEKVGAIPLFLGTFMITIVAMLVAVPVGLMAAVYLSDFASPRVRAFAKPMLEILAGVPTVVYGFFAAITVAPFIRDNSSWIVPILTVFAIMAIVAVILVLLDKVSPGLMQNIGRLAGGRGLAIAVVTPAVIWLLWTWIENPTFTFAVASESALAAGVVMGIMIIPFISSLSDDVINAVPQSLRDGSYGLGATKAETIRLVILPAALPGIVSAVLLGVSRAVGETMIVVMAAGQGANLTWNPMEAVTTVTVQIVALITGDTEAETAAGPAFALGFTLFCVTLALNVVALRIVRKYREAYD